MRLHVSWNDGPGTFVETTEALDRVLDEISAQTSSDHPVLVELVSATGDLLTLGMAGSESIAGWVQGSEEPPYLMSKGDPSAEGTTVFYLFGTWSEFPRSQCVPEEVARAAAREFLQTGALPKGIGWQEV